MTLSNIKEDNRAAQNIEVYQSDNGELSFNVNVFEETVWLTQKQMGALFDKNQSSISEHINNVYKEKELDKISTYRKFRLVQNEGNKKVPRYIEHYNLDMIISVGYRVKSQRGIQFRRWATKIFQNIMIIQKLEFV